MYQAKASKRVAQRKVQGQKCELREADTIMEALNPNPNSNLNPNPNPNP